MKKHRAVKIMVIVLLVLLPLTAVLAWWLAGFVMTGKRQTLDEAMQWQSEHYDTSFYDTLQKTPYTVQGDGGYILHAELLENPEPSSKYIILSHGYTDNRYGSLKYVQMYLDLGYNCIIYDLRGHGENKPTFTTYGTCEGADLNALIRDTRARYDGITQLGLHGESLGAATTVSALGYKPEVDFAVADCGFADIMGVLKNGYRQAHVPAFLADLADVGGRFRYHHALKDMRPVDALGENTVPVLFLHGAEDSFILPENSERMAQRTRGYSEVVVIQGAGHAESILKDPGTYRQAVEKFLEGRGF